MTLWGCKGLVQADRHQEIQQNYDTNEDNQVKTTVANRENTANSNLTGRVWRLRQDVLGRMEHSEAKMAPVWPMGLQVDECSQDFEGQEDLHDGDDDDGPSCGSQSEGNDNSDFDLDSDEDSRGRSTAERLARGEFVGTTAQWCSLTREQRSRFRPPPSVHATTTADQLDTIGEVDSQATSTRTHTSTVDSSPPDNDVGVGNQLGSPTLDSENFNEGGDA